MEAVRNAVGEEIDLMLEFHGRFSPIMALEAIRAMVPYRPRWCEEPIPAHNHESMAQVVAASPLRVATGEHTYSRFGFLDLLSRKGAHLIQPDIVYSGGFLETKKIAAIAETFYVSVAPHNCRGPLGTVIAMHLCANIPNFDILETFEDLRCSLALRLDSWNPTGRAGLLCHSNKARMGRGCERRADSCPSGKS